MSSLATEWAELRDKLAKATYADEVGQFIEPFFYSGALAALALQTSGITAQEVYDELLAYSARYPGWPHAIPRPAP